MSATRATVEAPPVRYEAAALVPARTSVAPTFLKDNTGTFFWTLPILASGPATDDALKRAMAAANFTGKSNRRIVVHVLQ